jgi:alpha-tubulin suppressor-like RCC1 family protein
MKAGCNRKGLFVTRFLLHYWILVIIASGQLHGGTGVVVSWGDRTIPLKFYEARRIISISAGGSQDVALRTDGAVVAWGNNGSGQSIVAAGRRNLRQVALGGAHSLAITSEGTVVAWGDNTYGQSLWHWALKLGPLPGRL